MAAKEKYQVSISDLFSEVVTKYPSIHGDLADFLQNLPPVEGDEQKFLEATIDFGVLAASYSQMPLYVNAMEEHPANQFENAPELPRMVLDYVLSAIGMAVLTPETLKILVERLKLLSIKPQTELPPRIITLENAQPKDDNGSIKYPISLSFEGRVYTVCFSEVNAGSATKIIELLTAEFGNWVPSVQLTATAREKGLVDQMTNLQHIVDLANTGLKGNPKDQNPAPFYIEAHKPDKKTAVAYRMRLGTQEPSIREQMRETQELKAVVG